MKIQVLLLLLLGALLASAKETYTFPHFKEEDLAFKGEEIQKRLLEETTYFEKSMPELRAIMAFGGAMEQQEAAHVLIHAGDQEAILRVVYCLKQGNSMAQSILQRLPSRHVIPFLMEELAHGNMEDLSKNTPYISYENLRMAATEIVANILSSIDEFPDQTREWLGYVSSGNGNKDINDLSQKSKFLVEWWILNEKAFMEGKWDKIVPLPHAGRYPPPPVFEQLTEDANWVPPEVDLPKVPRILNPLEVSESFEDWSARIIHPERRDLRWVKLTFENGKWIEHPPMLLDPLAPQPAPFRNVRRPVPTIATTEHHAREHWAVWIGGLAFVSGLLLWWYRLRKRKIGLV